MIRLLLSALLVLAWTSAAAGQELQVKGKIVLTQKHKLTLAREIERFDKKKTFFEGEECFARLTATLQISMLTALSGLAAYEGRERTDGEECPNGSEIVATRQQLDAWLAASILWAKRNEHDFIGCIANFSSSRC